jgi:hypothetical protein
MYIPEPPLQFGSLCYTASSTIFALHFGNIVRIHPAIPLLAWWALDLFYIGWLKAYTAYLTRELEQRLAEIAQKVQALGEEEKRRKEGHGEGAVDGVE